MTNARTTKRALLMSVVSLIVCFTMLLGTTYAWFTDSVTSAGNIIKSGTLDIEMYWADGKEDPATATWTDASTGAIFNNDKWEPGYAEVRHIKIKNEGTLALKYALSIAANGEVSKLADVIDVYYADPAVQVADRAALAAQTPMSNLTDALAGMATTANGTLLKDEEVIVTIALKMQETAGNEYQNLSIGSDFSIVLMATQKNYEKDSFDHNYDDIEIPDMDIHTINGVTYGATTDGDYVMISVDDYTLTNFTVDNKVTVLGTGNGVNDNDRVFGKDAPLTALTLPEGLVEIKDNALNALPNLTTVNLPSTLKTIGIQSFRTTGMSEVTVPAGVETIKAGAFRDMANLTTVTVEGNVAFDNYAFRSCPNLTSIYLLGDDVTFAGSQFATHNDSGDATGITIYVKNATVAARVYAAQTSAYGYEVKILGDATDGSDAATVPYAKNSSALDTAISSGASTVVLGSGTYTVDTAKNTSVTIVGNGSTIIDIESEGEHNTDYGFDGSNVVFENVVINAGGYLNGYARMNAVYNNCVINDTYTLNGKSVFNNCTFNKTGDDYCIWTWGAPTAEFNNCTFNTSGKAILLYGGANTSLKVTNCVFNDDNADVNVNNKAAIEVGSDWSTDKKEIIATGCTVNGFDITNKGTNTGSKLWGNKNSLPTDRLNVVIDGVDVY